MKMRLTFPILVAAACGASAAQAVTWTCRGSGHDLVIDEAAQTASVRGETTGGRDFDLSARSMRVGALASGERWVIFGGQGPQTWTEARFGRNVWVEVKFDRVADAYEAIIRRDDLVSGELEWLPYLSFSCDLPQ